MGEHRPRGSSPTRARRTRPGHVEAAAGRRQRQTAPSVTWAAPGCDGGGNSAPPSCSYLLLAGRCGRNRTMTAVTGLPRQGLLAAAETWPTCRSHNVRGQPPSALPPIQTQARAPAPVERQRPRIRLGGALRAPLCASSLTEPIRRGCGREPHSNTSVR
jgi:hypothetical protein